MRSVFSLVRKLDCHQSGIGCNFALQRHPFFENSTGRYLGRANRFNDEGLCRRLDFTIMRAANQAWQEDRGKKSRETSVEDGLNVR